MFGSFLPPVVFQVTANATQAMATFKGVNTQLKVMEAQALKTGVAMSRFNKAAVIGIGALKVFAAAAAVMAGIGIKSAMDLEKSYNRLGQALTNMGLASEQNRAQLSELMQSYEDLGFGAEQAADAFTVLINSTGSLERSQRLLALSADVARAKNMSLEAASRLVNRSANGSTRLFREYGIVLDANKDKTVATEEALQKLEARLGGQAAAYAKTFAGQMAVLNEKLGDFFEAIGLKILPVLTKFVDKLNGTGKFIKDYNEEIMALTAAIVVALIPAVVSLTRKLVVLAATILKSPIARVAIAIFAVAYAFIRAYNASEDFRKKVGKVIDFALSAVGFLVNAVENVVQVFMLAEKGVIKLGLAWAKFRGDEKRQKELEAELRTWEKQYAAIDKWSDSIENARKKVRQFSDKKLELKWDFKIPQIPGFGDGASGGAAGLGKELSQSVKDGLKNAMDAIKQFNRDAKAEFKGLVTSWKQIINRDFAGEIEFWLDDSVDELVKRAQLAVNAYADASEGYASAMSKLTKAQNNYIDAVKTGKEKVIEAAQAAMKSAEDSVNGIMDAMGSALDNIKGLQDEMIQAVVAAKREIRSLEDERSKVLAEARKERLILEDKYNKTVAGIRKKYNEDVAAAEYDAATRRAEIIQSSVNMLRDAFRTATYRTVGDIYQALTFQGRYLKGGTPEKIIAALGLEANKAEKLAANAASLAGLGFSQTFIQEVIALGPDVGNQLATTILNSTPESIARMKEYWTRLQTVSNTGVDTLAKQLNSGVTLATAELTQQLADVGVVLNQTLVDLDSQLTTALAEAFEEYSKSLDEINQRTIQQIAEIDKQISALTAKIAQLQAAMAALSNLGKPGTSNAGVDVIGAARAATTVTQNEAVKAAAAETDRLRAETARIRAQMEERKTAAAFKADQLAGSASSVNRANWRDPIISSTSTSTVDERTKLLQGAGTTINIVANTNASSQDIANDVGWAIRTSGDVQYRVGGGGGKYGMLVE